ncbi:hypothetical protein Smp_160050 [Schistosoma mansoni]|uniref:hypothetical protein n=1 Tax=Schistosoma mansoni TaxID=6183 RepID=UPI0001A625E6|nr:hypothetical protein Smp_160050 [Schistosoma mansoni]|eukprot:XP_018646754.1 hypothetical protein Smp_160050 [Schistosoma mansoni]
MNIHDSGFVEIDCSYIIGLLNSQRDISVISFTSCDGPGSTITTASSTITSFPPNPSSILETSFTEDDFLRFNQISTHVISTFRQCYQPICESMVELISQVHKTKEHFGIDGPITVHCMKCKDLTKEWGIYSP